MLEDIALDGAATQHPPAQVAALGESNAVGLAAFGAVASEPSLAGLAALALAALAAAGARKRS